MKPKELKYPVHTDEYGRIKTHHKIRQEVAEAYPDQDLYIIIKPRRKTRSSPQNRYYWGVIVWTVVKLLIESGNPLQLGNPDHHKEVHRWLLDMFGKPADDIILPGGEVVPGPKTTTRHDTVDQEEYHEKIRQWVAETFSHVIPLPNEQTELSFT